MNKRLAGLAYAEYPATGESRVPALVVLPGMPADIRGLRRMARMLARRRRVLLIEPLGGASSEAPSPCAGPECPYAWPAQVRRLQRALDQLGLREPFDLLGWSFGGAWAQQLLLRAPERARRAVLVATCGRLRARERAILELLITMVRASALDGTALLGGMLPLLFSPAFLHRPGALAVLRLNLGSISWSREAWAAQLEALLRHELPADSRERLVAVRGVIAGDEDWLFPTSELARLASALPRAQLEVIEETGHAIWVERADALVDAVDTLLA